MRQLRGRTPHELYSRTAQRAYAFSERALLRMLGVRRGQAIGMHVGYSSLFFPGIELARKSTLASTVSTLRARVPADESEVLARAAAAERGDISLFGYGVMPLGERPDWQRDPISGLRAPQRHWSTIPYLNRDVVGDHKVVWEINRHQYFVTLGQAFAYSQDDRWPRAFVRMFDAWLEDNPPTIGMNWCSSLEVSYRAISWIWALQLMRESSELDAAFRARARVSLEAHGRHLERYLSTYFSPNTHLTGEALGLCYIGTQCPELPRARHWAKLGASILEQELDRQVLSDGVYFEQATQYHRYTIDIYLHYWLLTGMGSPRVSEALNKMFDVLLHLTRPDGTIPLIGDDDGGRLLQLDARAPHDVRALLATGAVWLGRSDLAWVGRGDDAALCWMSGAAAIQMRDQLVGHRPAELDKAFTTGGLFVMRDGWDRSASVAVIDAGPHGALSYGHSHADPLAIDLTLGGHALFVDSGTYTYVGDERNAFRTTAAHNTVEIDGIGSSIPHTAFRWKTVSNAAHTDWTVRPEFAYFRGTHDGYQQLADPVTHARSVFHNHSGLWIVRDELSSVGSHEAVLRWHCAPGLTPRVMHQGDGQCELEIEQGAGSRATLVLAGSSAGAQRIDESWVSAQFGQKSPAKVCTWRQPVNGNAVLASIVIDTTRYSIAREDGNGQALGVQGAAVVLALDIVTPVETGLPSDPLSAQPSERLLVIVGNGRTITFNARTIDAAIVLLRLDRHTGQQLGLIAVPLLSPS